MDQATIADRVKARKLMRERGKKRKRASPEKNYILLSDDSDSDPVPVSEEQNTAMSDKTLSENESLLVRKRNERRREKYGSNHQTSSKGKGPASSSMRSVDKSKSGSDRPKHHENGAHLSMDSGDSFSAGHEVVVFGANWPVRRNKKVPVDDGIEYVTEMAPEPRDLLSKASKDHKFSDYMGGNSSDEHEDPSKYMSRREVPTEDYDWREIGKASAEFQLPSGSVSRRKHAEFQLPSGSVSRRKHAEFQVTSELGPRRRELSKLRPGKSRAVYQELSEPVPRRNHDRFQELHKSMSRKSSKPTSSRSHRLFQKPSGSRRYSDDFQVPSQPRRCRDDFYLPSKPRRYRDDFQVSSEPRRYRDDFQVSSEPRRYRDEHLESRDSVRMNRSKFLEPGNSVPRKNLELSHSIRRRHRDELQEPSHSRSRRYLTAFPEPDEPMRRRKHAEYQEPSGSRSRRSYNQIQKERKSMSRRKHERVYLEEPVQPAGASTDGRDNDINIWMKYYAPNTRNRAEAKNYAEPKIMRRHEDNMEEEEEMGTENTDETEEEDYEDYEENEEEEEDGDEEEEDEQREEREGGQVEVFPDNNRASNDGIVLVGEKPGTYNNPRKPRRIRGRRLLELQTAVAREIAESSKAPDQQQGAESQIPVLEPVPVPMPVKDERVDEEEFLLAVRASEDAGPSGHAEAQEHWTGSPAREIIDYDEVSSKSPTSSSASETDQDDADYKVGEESDEGENIVEAEPEESEAAAAATSVPAKEDFVFGEKRRFKRLRKGLPCAETSVDLQDHILGAIFGNGNAQANAAPSAIPEEVMTEANAQEDTPAADDNMTEENVEESTPVADDTMEANADESTPVADDTIEANADESTPVADDTIEANTEEVTPVAGDMIEANAGESTPVANDTIEANTEEVNQAEPSWHMAEPGNLSQAAESTVELSKEIKAASGAEGSQAAESSPVEVSDERKADYGAEGSQATESSPMELFKESEAASGEDAMVEKKTEEEIAAPENPPLQIVEAGHFEDGTATSIGTPSEKAATEKISDEERSTAESTLVITVEKGLVEETDGSPNEKVITEKISEEENAAAEEHAEEGADATGAAENPQGETVAKTATADEPMCYRSVLPSEKKNSEKSTRALNMAAEGRPHGTKRARPQSDVNCERRMRRDGGAAAAAGSSKRSRKSSEIVLVGEWDPNDPQSSRPHQKAGSSRRSHHHTGNRDEVVMVTEKKTSAGPHQAPPLAPISRPKSRNGPQASALGPIPRPETSIGPQASALAPISRPETSIGHQAPSSGRRARPETSISNKATSLGHRARPESSSSHQAPASRRRARPESSSSHQAPASSRRARPESNSSHQAASSGHRARPEPSNAPSSGPIAHPESSPPVPHLGLSDGKESEEEEENEEEEEEEEEAEEIQNNPGPKEKKLVIDLLKSIVGEEDEALQDPLVEPSSWNGPTLPKKFRFPDEDPKPEVKSEYDNMVDDLFIESGMNEGRFGYEDEPSQQEEIREEVPQGEQEPTCPHEFYIKEPIGRICRLCFHIETEMRYIDLPFAQDPYRLQKLGDREKVTKLKGIDFSPEEAEQSEHAFSAEVGTVWDAIPGAKSRMYEHQQEGFEFMWKNLEGTINLAELKKSEDSDIGGCIISHAPGTGKTLLTLMFINAYLKIFPNSRPMIIAPASMLLTWEEEFKKWNMDSPFHNLNHIELTGKERQIQDIPTPTGKAMDKDVIRLIKIYSWTKGRSVLGISYNLFENLVGGEYKKVRSTKQKLKKKKKIAKPGQRSQKYKKLLLEMPRVVIMDEGHTPRNSNSCIWNTVLKLQTKRKIILTGTPFQNNFMELFNTLRLVRPKTADSLLKERSIAPMLAVKGGKYAPKKKQVEGSETNKEPSVDNAIVKLKDIISPFVHVHKGYILKRSLPGLKDSVLLLKPPPMQKHLIKLMEGAKGVSSFDYEYKVALISTHPSLAVYCALDDRERAALNMPEVVSLKDDYKEGVKTRFVMELVRLSIDHGEKVLVFSQYQQVHKLMEEQLRAFFNWEEGRQVIQMHGKQDQKVRQQLITKFNDPNSEAVVLLASTKCCSEGINLVGASRVVLLDVVWNPSVERQAISRAYRLGQQKVVHTYHLMAAGTSEGDKYCRQVEKDRLSELVFSSTTKEAVPEKDPALASASAIVTASAASVGDVILQSMLQDVNFKDMVEKIIYQPKEVNLIESFTIASAEA